MTRIEHEVTIDRPVEDVGDYLTDSRHGAEWVTNVVEVGRGGDVPPAPALEARNDSRTHGP